MSRVRTQCVWPTHFSNHAYKAERKRLQLLWNITLGRTSPDDRPCVCTLKSVGTVLVGHTSLSLVAVSTLPANKESGYREIQTYLKGLLIHFRTSLVIALKSIRHGLQILQVYGYDSLSPKSPELINMTP